MDPVVVTSSHQASRCAFCHDDIVADDEKAECAGCRTVLHRECREALPECPTLGCRHSVFTLRDVTPGSPRRAPRTSFRRALANLATNREAVDRAKRERPPVARGPLGWLVTLVMGPEWWHEGIDEVRDALRRRRPADEPTRSSPDE